MTLPEELQNLSGIAKNRIEDMRSRIALGLIHSDDLAHPTGWTLKEQMAQLQRRANLELRRL